MKSAISNRSSLGTSPNPPRFNASELIRLRNIKTPSDCLSSILPKTSSSYYGIQNNPSSSGVKNSRFNMLILKMLTTVSYLKSENNLELFLFVTLMKVVFIIC